MNVSYLEYEPSILLDSQFEYVANFVSDWSMNPDNTTHVTTPHLILNMHTYDFE